MSTAGEASESLRAQLLSPAGRERCRQLWRASIGEVVDPTRPGDARRAVLDSHAPATEAWQAAGQLAAARSPDLQLLLITAWNPWSLSLAPPVNAARDRVLRDELRAWGFAPLRSRARSVDHAWSEDGWAVAAPYHAEPIGMLRREGHALWWSTVLRRHGQLALFCFQDGRRYLGWCDGMVELFAVENPTAHP